MPRGYSENSQTRSPVPTPSSCRPTCWRMLWLLHVGRHEFRRRPRRGARDPWVRSMPRSSLSRSSTEPQGSRSEPMGDGAWKGD